METIIDFLIRENRIENEHLIKYRTKFINITVQLVALIALVMGFVRYFHAEYVMSIIDFILFSFGIYIIFYNQVNPKNINRVIQVFLFVFFFFSFFLMYAGDYAVKVTMFFMFLSAAMFLQGKKAGFYWYLAILIASILLYLFTEYWTGHNLTSFLMLLFFLTGHYSVILLYENQQVDSQKALESINHRLDQTVKSRTQELEVQKEAFETLYNKSSDGILLLENQKFIDCNESVVKMLAFDSKKEVIDKTPLDLSPKFQADGMLSYEKADLMIKKCEKYGTCNFEWLHLKSDGKEFWCEVVLTRIMLHQKPIIHVVWRDISLRKVLEHDVQKQAQKLEEFNTQLEEKVQIQVAKVQETLDNFKILIDSIIEAVVLFDAADGIVECNKVALDMFGYNRSEIMGKDIYDFVHKDDRDIIDNNLLSNTSEPYEVRAVTSDGRVIPILVSGADMIYNDSAVRIVTIVDLSELKQKDQILQLQSRHAVMGEMIGMIAHQWRQPLAAVSGTVATLNLDIMMDHYDNKLFKDHLERINQHIQFLSTTIDDFRNFFKENKQLAPTSLETIIDDSLKIIGPTVEENSIEIIKEYKSDYTFYSYPNELKQVVLNLIKNAQDALLENRVKSPRISLSTSRIHNDLTLEVWDNAGGISEVLIDSIFEPYFTTKEKKDGTGLGLYMSKMIIEEHCDGEISVKNCEEGAKFTILLKCV
ncbi:MAG: PAS domain-containing protein [Epsilonproteobacteria bacterium]|nr:PAS domain-containing protein [Campylobacterota bacterium]